MAACINRWVGLVCTDSFRGDGSVQIYLHDTPHVREVTYLITAVPHLAKFLALPYLPLFPRYI